MAWYPVRTTGVYELHHGYSLADVERLAQTVTATTRAMAGDYEERYSEAHFAIVVHLFEAEHRPVEHELFRAGQDALFYQSRKDRSYHGCAYKQGQGWGDSGTGPNFITYWGDLQRTTPSPEDRIVDRLALAQILPTLSPGQLQVLQALAATGDHGAAKLLTGINPKTFGTQISNARARFLQHWHEGEQPSLPWGTDRPTGARGVMGVIRRRKKEAAKAAGRAPEPAAPAGVDILAACCPDYCDDCPGCDGPCHHPDEPLAVFVDRVLAGEGL